MPDPTPRGPVSAAVLDAVHGRSALDAADLVARVERATGDVLADEDLQLALWVAYELHYGGLDGVDDAWEWDPDLLRVRRALETRLEDRLRELTAAGVAAALASPRTSRSGSSHRPTRATAPR